MKILVTGSSGFIGHHLCNALEQQAHEVIRADRHTGIDLCDPTQVKQLPDVDYVVHLAAHNGTKHFYNRPFDVVRDNLLPTQFLLERYAGKVQRFVFTGTCESYAGAVDMFEYPVPTDEKVPLVVGDVTNPRWSYGGTKIANEIQVAAAHHQLAQQFAIIRYHNVYGPGQVDHFIPEFYERALTGDLSLFGWENTRSFMYISDAISATLQVIFNPVFANEITNIGVDDEVSIKQLAETIMKVGNIDGTLILKDAPPGSVRRRCGDVTKMNMLIGNQHRVQLETGIKLTLESLK
jgi:nucleoside-diphosphate-sugar epimerase